MPSLTAWEDTTPETSRASSPPHRSGISSEATHRPEGVSTVDLPDDYDALAPSARRLAAGVRKANHDVFTISSTYQQHHGMGSTMVAIHLCETGEIYVGHVGDSRCYRIRDGEILQLTRDHSLINDALEMKPDLLPEEIARLPKNIITRALGMKDAVKVDIRSERAEPGDVYLLCSDGLTGMVPDAQILEVVSLTDDPKEACELLIAEANDAGGTDNISAVIIQVAEARTEADLGEIETHESQDTSLEALGLDESGELEDPDDVHGPGSTRLTDPLRDGSVPPPSPRPSPPATRSTSICAAPGARGRRAWPAAPAAGTSSSWATRSAWSAARA